MSFEQKLYLRKPHIRKVNGVWSVYFSNAPGACNWSAWEFIHWLHMRERA